MKPNHEKLHLVIFAFIPCLCLFYFTFNSHFGHSFYQLSCETETSFHLNEMNFIHVLAVKSSRFSAINCFFFHVVVVNIWTFVVNGIRSQLLLHNIVDIDPLIINACGLNEQQRKTHIYGITSQPEYTKTTT